jgi:hypothetical protein
MLSTVSHDAFDAQSCVGQIAVLQCVGRLVLKPPDKIADMLFRDWIA